MDNYNNDIKTNAPYRAFKDKDIVLKIVPRFKPNDHVLQLNN